MTQYEIKAQNLIDGILDLVELLVQTNGEIEMKIEANKAEAELSKQRLEQINIENANLVKQKESNEAFVGEITEIVNRYRKV